KQPRRCVRRGQKRGQPAYASRSAKVWRSNRLAKVKPVSAVPEERRADRVFPPRHFFSEKVLTQIVRTINLRRSRISNLNQPPFAL
ncbi:MAG: hypothetical protein M3Z22_06330, partial [Verrucomicrobiota bacterium]|nr:hypothetical protein [Verrucomicrobiota bacterium]